MIFYETKGKNYILKLKKLEILKERG